MNVKVKQFKNGWVKVINGPVAITTFHGPAKLYVKLGWHSKRILCATAPFGQTLMMAMGGVIVRTGDYYKIKGD